MKKYFIILLSTLFSFHLMAQPSLTLTPVISTGLSSPLQIAHPGDGTNRLFVVEKGGAIKVFSQTFTSLGTFLTIPSSSLSNGSEEGLLSMAFHPDYHSNGFFYVFIVNSNSELEIDRYKVDASNINLADASSKKIVLTIPHTYSNHNGGKLNFGSDGYLYLSTGDGGSSGDPENNSQNTTSLLGKILRLNVNTSNTSPYYTVPATNPFGNEVYVYGLRNPFRWTFDRYNGDLYIGDVGQNAWEEFDYRPAALISGSNFGWRCKEGNADFNTAGCTGTYLAPFYVYGRSSAMGGQVYRGYKYLNLKGYYLGVDHYTGRFYKALLNSSTGTFTVSTQNFTSPKGIADISENELGELFATSITTNTVYRIQSDGTSLTTYTFIGNGSWTTASNWAESLIPPAILPSSAVIVIKPRKDGVCNLNTVQTIDSGGNLIVEPGKIFNVNSNLTIKKP